jgi:hypothetical protein
VAEHGRRVSGRIRAGRGVEIGVADAARDEANENLGLLRLREIELLHHERSAEFLEDSGLDAHCAILVM